VIQCPWCSNHVQLVHSTCPECKHMVLPEHLDETLNGDHQQENDTNDYSHLDVKEILMNRFHCSKCKHDECNVKEVAMTGTGLSKLLDIQHQHFLFVSCLNCGITEIYDPDVLRGTKSGQLGTIMDVLFGG